MRISGIEPSSVILSQRIYSIFYVGLDYYIERDLKLASIQASVRDCNNQLRNQKGESKLYTNDVKSPFFVLV